MLLAHWPPRAGTHASSVPSTHSSPSAVQCGLHLDPVSISTVHVDDLGNRSSFLGSFGIGHVFPFFQKIQVRLKQELPYLSTQALSNLYPIDRTQSHTNVSQQYRTRLSSSAAMADIFANEFDVYLVELKAQNVEKEKDKDTDKFSVAASKLIPFATLKDLAARHGSTLRTLPLSRLRSRYGEKVALDDQC